MCVRVGFLEKELGLDCMREMWSVEGGGVLLAVGS